MSRRKAPTKTRPPKPDSKAQTPLEVTMDRDDSVDEASRESFPASDAPAWIFQRKRKKT